MKKGTERKKPAGGKAAKAARKKPAVAVKREPAVSAARKELLAKLRAALEPLPDEDLASLIRQAQILQHNRSVLEGVKHRRTVETVATMRGGTVRQDKSTIDVSEAEDGSHFILIINRARNFFSRDEMRTLVKICHAANDANDGAMRLYRWFREKRHDVLVDTNIDNGVDRALYTMYNFIISTYRLKEG